MSESAWVEVIIKELDRILQTEGAFRTHPDFKEGESLAFFVLAQMVELAHNDLPQIVSKTTAKISLSNPDAFNFTNNAEVVSSSTHEVEKIISVLKQRTNNFQIKDFALDTMMEDESVAFRGGYAATLGFVASWLRCLMYEIDKKSETSFNSNDIVTAETFRIWVDRLSIIMLCEDDIENLITFDKGEPSTNDLIKTMWNTQIDPEFK